MKQIEPGCTAIILGVVPENLGMIVTVGKYLGDVVFSYKGEHWRSKKAWEIDKEVLGLSGNRGNFISEAYLERLDNDDETQTIKESEETEI